MMRKKMMQTRRNSTHTAAAASLTHRRPRSHKFFYGVWPFLHQSSKTALMDSISLPVVAPKLDRLKRSGSWLHLLAGALILTHAFSHFRGETTHTLYFWCMLFISLDIFLLVLVGRDILQQAPRLNLLFRIIEITFFAGIG